MAKSYAVFKDGTAWCATGEGFIDLQNSLAGFGDSPVEALGELIVAEGDSEIRRCEKIREWKCNNCQTSFGRRATMIEKPPCPACKCGSQYVYEV